jgi:hypothetical protein
MLANRSLQLAFAGIAGLFAARTYYRWLLGSGMLQSSGEVAYWLLLGAPALALFVPLCVLGLRRRKVGAGWVAAGAAVVAILVAYLGLFGDFLLCASITRASCE